MVPAPRTPTRICARICTRFVPTCLPNSQDNSRNHKTELTAPLPSGSGAVKAFQCSTPEGRLALSRTLSESDQGAIALHAYVDGPAWLTTDLVEDIQQAGMVPVFIVQPKVGRLRLITASSGCPGMSPRSVVEPLSRCAILPDLSCD